MFQRKRYPNYRAVSSMQRNGSLVIKIDAVSNWSLYAVYLIIASGVFVSGCWMLVPVLFKIRTLTEALYCLPFVAFLPLWFMVSSRVILERLCSVELSAGSGIFRWSYRISRWGKDIEARQNDVTAVIAKTRWYGSRLSITMNGRTYSVSDLLKEDMETVVRELRRALPEARS